MRSRAAGCQSERTTVGTVDSHSMIPSASRLPERPDQMDPSPQFTVVIPTYGRPQLLPEALASVLGQTVPDLECIVVDDASPEPVAVEPNERVRLVRREENGGPAAGRNTGAAEARGRYLAFLDDDDWWEPDRLELAVPALERAPVAVCWSRFDDD